MSHLRNNSAKSGNCRPTPEVADPPPASSRDIQRNLQDDATLFKAFLKRNLHSPSPAVPADLLGKILDRIDAVDAERLSE